MKKTSFSELLIFVLIITALLFGMAYVKNLNQPGVSLVVRTLQAQDFENIQTGSALLGNCKKGEIPTGFTATRGGAPVSGVVCEDIVLQTAYIKFK